MTNLKFRVWNKNTKKMYNVRCIDTLYEAVDAIDGNGCVLMKFQDVEIMQSTGLKDKNGKEIFEEDIVKIEGELFTADFYEGSFWFFTEGDFPHLDISVHNGCEVVGNTFENPELLNS